MKEISIFYKSYQKYGGQEGVIWNLSRMLAESGYSVNIYTAKAPDKVEHGNIKLHKIFIPPAGSGLKTLLFALYSFRKAKKIDHTVLGFGKTFHQDIFRAGGGVHLYYFKRAKLKYRSRLSRGLYIAKKTLSLSHWVNIWIEKKTFSDGRLKRIIVPSEFVKRQILQHFRVEPSKLYLLRNGVDLERFRPCKEEERKKLRASFSENGDQFLFGFVSTNHRLKGLEYLLEALNLLKAGYSNFRLIVAGSGADSFFKKRIKKLQLHSNIVWLGRVNNPRDIYCAIDLLVYPTLFDASSNVVIEAMACSTPVASSVFNGTAELIKENENGLLIRDPTDTDEIYRILKYSIENRNRLREMGIKARKTAEEFPYELFYRRFLDVCNSTSPIK